MTWWNAQQLKRIDFRVLPIIGALLLVGLLVISSHTSGVEERIITPLVKKQLEWTAVGVLVYFFFAGFNYTRLREFTWILYPLMLLALFGLFFTDPIQRVQRWYRIPGLGMSIQPSENAKLVVVIALSWFLERRRDRSSDWSTAFFAGIILGVPFLLILKQPDLGSAMVLYPIALVMFYFGDIHPKVIRTMAWIGGAALLFIAVIFMGVVPHESVRPYATKVIKEYQFDRLNPDTHHQKAATTAIAVGGFTGTGWRHGTYTLEGWLPAPYTDSVFSAFGEEFGFLGLTFLLFLFYALIYCCFQVTAVAKDEFGRLLSAGISVYIAMHVLVNIGMMCGMLPITGVPLLLVTYGGSSILSTMAALGILQSVYSRRFMF